MRVYCNYYHYLTTPKQLLILGAGFGGLASANLLRKSLPGEEWQITVIDKNQYFMINKWCQTAKYHPVWSFSHIIHNHET